MTDQMSKRRMIENEASFRQYNERAKQQLEDVKGTAKSADRADVADPEELELHFYCECSDEKCAERISIQLTKYSEIHENRNHFIVLPGHQVEAVEKVIADEKDYYLIEKYITPTEHPEKLHKTDLNNT